MLASAWFKAIKRPACENGRGKILTAYLPIKHIVIFMHKHKRRYAIRDEKEA